MLGLHEAKKKNHLKLLGAFVLGAVLTLAITGASGVAWQGKLLTDLEKEQLGELESALPDFFGDCETTNCDLEDMIAELHDEVGHSTWTLEEMAIRQYDMAAYVGLWLTNEIDDLHDEVGYSTWTLDAIGINQSVQSAYNRGIVVDYIEDLHDEVGYSSWTLEGLANLLYEIYDEVN